MRTRRKIMVVGILLGALVVAGLRSDLDHCRHTAASRHTLRVWGMPVFSSTSPGYRPWLAELEIDLPPHFVDYLEFHINHRYGGNVFVRGANGSMLEIIPSEGERSDDTMKTPGIRHLAIIPDDFDAAHQALKDKGVTFFTDTLNMDGNRLVFFEDGDGNILHLIQRPQPLP